MTAGQVVVGWLLLAVQVAACTIAGRGLRRRLAPAWQGPWAVVAAGVAAVAVLVVTGQVLGAVGLLRRWVLPPALVAVACVLHHRRHPRQPHDPPPGPQGTGPEPPPAAALRGPPSPPLVRLAATVATAAVAAAWIERVVAVYRRGLTDGDSLMYHLVFAARFVQSGSISGADPVGPDAWVAFYPANTELVDAALMLPFGTDVVVPLVNLAWLALALGASWCIGAEVGRGPLGLVVGALMASAPVLVATQAGTARVDITVIALILAAVALVLHQPSSAGTYALAGLAVGLAIGSKLALLPLAGLLVVLVAVVLVRREGARAALAWSATSVAMGAYWYVRNWAIAGSPVPAIDLRVFGIGFAPLPADRRALLNDSSIVDRLDEPGFWGDIARPVAAQVFATPVISVAVAVTAVAVIGRVLGQRPWGLRHAVLLAGVGGCVAYPFAPYSAPLLDVGTGSPFSSVIVGLNVRYLLPSLAVVLCLLPLALDGLARIDRIATTLVAAGSIAVVFLWIDNMSFEAEWPTTRSDSVVAAVLVAAIVAVVAVVVTAAVAVGRPTEAEAPRPAVPGMLGLAGTVAVAVAVMGVTAWVAAGRSGLHRHGGLPAGHTQLWAAAEDVPGRDIALLHDWVQYPLMGEDLDREVHYVGLPRGQGLTDPPRTCAEMDAALAAHPYDLVVLQRPIVTGEGRRGDAACLRQLTRVDLVFENDTGAVYRLR